MKRSAGNPLDLRAWLDTARKLGELKDVRGADWNLELGAISELNVKIDSAPAGASSSGTAWVVAAVIIIAIVVYIYWK